MSACESGGGGQRLAFSAWTTAVSWWTCSILALGVLLHDYAKRKKQHGHKPVVDDMVAQANGDLGAGIPGG
jgi:hypothetical protein